MVRGRRMWPDWKLWGLSDALQMVAPLMLYPIPRDLALGEMFPDSLRRISEARRNLLVALQCSVSSIVDRRIKICGHGDEGGNGWDVQVQGHLTQGSMGSQQCSCQALSQPFVVTSCFCTGLPGLSSPGYWCNLSWPQNSRQLYYIFPLYHTIWISLNIQ